MKVYCDKCKHPTEYTGERTTRGRGDENMREYSVTIEYRCPQCGRELQRYETRTDTRINGRWQRSQAISVTQSIYSLDGLDVGKFNPDMLAMAMGIRMYEAQELAEECDVGLHEIEALERGQLPLDASVIQMIAKVLQFPVKFFLQEGKRYGPMLPYHERTE